MWDITHLAEIDSTMDWLKNQPLINRKAVIADVQTAGRGRRGGQWDSPVGNLYLSFTVSLTPTLLEKLPFIMALAVRDVLPAINTQLKWPNDTWVDGQKLGGVLIERVGDFAVCGLGLNIEHAPEYAVSLKQLKVDTNAKVMADKILKAFDEWETRSDWVKSWNYTAAFMSDKVTFNHGGVTKTSIFEGIDKKGRAILLDPSVNLYHAYASGEISQFRPKE